MASANTSSYLTPLMQETVKTQGFNQANEYERTQAEIEKQRRELEEQKKKEGSFLSRMKRGAVGAIPGAIAGAMTGNPIAIAGGAAAGFAGGALSSPGTNTAGLGVMAAGMANKGSSYLSSGPQAATVAPATPFSGGNVQPDMSELQSAFASGAISPQQYNALLLEQQRANAGGIY